MGLALSAAFCGVSAAWASGHRGKEMVEVVLHAGPRNIGQNGRAWLAARNDATAITYTVTGVPPWMARPVRLYTFVYAGSCAQHSEPPVHALNESVQAGLFSRSSAVGPFTLAKTVPQSLDALRSGAFALVVRTSPADGNVDLFCGDLRDR
jgi:hypothetical protein